MSAFPLDSLIDRLPQKPPFLFVQHVTALEPGTRVKGSIVFPPGHAVFENHLPGEPLVPGVILIEALAQLSGIALLEPDGAPLRGYLAEVTRMRFHRLIHPGEEISLEAEVAQAFGFYARFRASARVGDELAAEGELIVARAPAEHRG